MTGWGMFVTLPNTVEVRYACQTLLMTTIHLMNQSTSLLAKRTGRTYRLGEKINVRVIDADKALASITMLPENSKE